MARKTYNPYVLKNKAINRFRGIVNADNPFAIADSFVGDMESLFSFKAGELGVQDAHLFKETFEQPIYSGSRVLGYVILSAGSSVWFEKDDPDLSEGIWSEDPDFASTSSHVAKNLVSQYFRNVFSGTDRPWIGIDQRKGAFYGGNGVQKASALVFDDLSFQPEEIGTYSESLLDTVYSGHKANGYVTIASGSSIWVDL